MIRAVLLLALGQTGCSMLHGVEGLAGTATSAWYSVGPVRKPATDILGTARDVIVKQGYTVGTFDAAEGRVESNWDVQLSAHWREGNRTKLEAELEESGPGAFVVRVRSHTELNNNAKQPLSLQHAEWIGASLDKKWEGRMNEPAQRFHTMLKLRFFGLDQ